jgi:hypothetical protein
MLPGHPSTFRIIKEFLPIASLSYYQKYKPKTINVAYSARASISTKKASSH